MSQPSPFAQRPGPAQRPAVRAALGLGLALGLGFSVGTLWDAVSYIGRPFPNFGYTEGCFVNPVLFAPEHEPGGVRLWDRVEAVNGQPVSRGPDITALLTPMVPGTSARFTVSNLDGLVRDVTVPVTRFGIWDFFRWHTSQAPRALAILLIGALVFALRSGPRAQAFCTTCLFTGLMLDAGVDGTLFHRFPPLFHLSAPFVPAAGLSFAVTLSPRLARHQRRAWVWGVPLSLGVLLAVALGVVSNGPAGLYAGLGVTTYVLLLLGAVGFFVVLLDAWLRPEGPLERARAGVILATWPLALGIPAINFLLGFTLRSYELTSAPNAAILLMPAGVAWGIFRSQLFDADLRLRRVLAELFITGLFTALYAGALMAAYVVYPEAADSPSVAVALAATLLALASPLRDRAKRLVDQVLEGRRYDPQEALASLAASLTAELSLERALQRVDTTLGATVRPSSVSVILLGDAEAPSVHHLHGEPLPVVGQQAWMDAALVLPRARAASSLLEEDDSEQKEVRRAERPVGVDVVVPLRSGGRELGALLLGPRADRRRAWSAADLIFLRAVAGQAAPTLATARAFAEIDRLNRTLEDRVARRTAELTAANEELRELDRRKDEFVSTVSHDFRSPLSIIRSHVETMRSDPQMDEQTRRSFLNVVERQARRLTSMVENLLDLARIRNRGMATQELSAQDVVRSAADGARPRMEQAGVRFKVDVPDSEIRLRADPDRLGQVFHNLLDNAARFTPSGGQVVLRAQQADGQVTFSVADTGIGIPPEDQPRICEAFYQVKRAGAERDGSGLGLAIVKEIIARHGSDLQLSSNPGGTTWSFTLPLLTAEPAAPSVA